MSPAMRRIGGLKSLKEMPPPSEGGKNSSSGGGGGDGTNTEGPGGLGSGSLAR